MDIYAFPPAAITAWQLSEDRPVRRSDYALDGKRTVSSAGPARRRLQMTCSALGYSHHATAGYLAQLWRYIDGGVGLVRLNLPPQNWHLHWCALRQRIGNTPVVWSDSGAALDWTAAGSPLSWFANTVRMATVTTLAGYPAAVQVTGLPANMIVARPGDILRVWATDHSTSATARVLDLTRSDASGVAVVPLDVALPAGVAAFADEESAVFEVLDYAPQAQQLGRNWTVGLTLIEVLASEIDSPVEVTPWRA